MYFNTYTKKKEITPRFLIKGQGRWKEDVI